VIDKTEIFLLYNYKGKSFVAVVNHAPTIHD